MGRVEACRICLITDVKMHRIQGTLETNFKSVFGHNVMLSSDMPDYCCYECSALIHKFSKFRKKYFTSQGLLFSILQNHGVVTEQEIKNIDRVASNLNSNLSTIVIKGDEQLEIKIESEPINELEMTVDDEMDNSGSEDDVPLHSMKPFEHTDPMANIIASHQSAAIPVITDAVNLIHEVLSEGTSREIENVATQQSLGTEGHQTLEGINNIYAIQQHIMENQEKIVKKLAEISVQVEELRNVRQPTTVTLLGEAQAMEVESFMLRPINHIDNLEKLEQDLSNKEKFEKLKQQYSIVCSELLGNGVNCAYRLLDILFTKDFLCQCSWTGGSRNAVDVKIGFKAFKNVIKFFFTMVNLWDSSYTMEQNENFFKMVLRNALKRKHMKNIRSSAKKSRVKGKINNKNNGNDQENSAASQNLNENNQDDNQIGEQNEEESLC